MPFDYSQSDPDLHSSAPNSPMGLFGPGFKEVGDYMNAMQAQLADNAVKYNCEQMFHMFLCSQTD